ncbi:PREDICTED: interferon-induced transmembrane protein 3-like [Gekko japonicus]|uniref:Interferon-induced transmembrane protein 3-like n=1 Tax=Gekko japonicus TaxID=146911 RepID=A0ABM1JQC4_GEKJA|nr:PREDICTED: interferon-induced transmembrane protein 3-like [Gekko japonicus]
MDHLNYQGSAPSAPNPPPYSEKEPYDQQPPPVDGSANSTMPSRYQPYYAPYSEVPGQGPVIQPPLHTTFVVPVQPTHEKVYLAYSIFTMLFCCLPLGIAALVYSIRTQDANRMGNGTEAQRNSRMARSLAHAALIMGIVSAIAYTVLIVLL